jgi:hypothetical protein
MKMPKAVLVMDMPENCENCACKYPSYKDDALYDCAITGKTIPINGGHYEDRPDWCTLRELPEKETEMTDADDLGVEYVRGTMDGWNACLDEILKECDADGNT